MSPMRDLRRLGAAALVAGSVAVFAVGCIPPSGRVASPTGAVGRLGVGRHAPALPLRPV